MIPGMAQEKDSAKGAGSDDRRNVGSFKKQKESQKQTCLGAQEGHSHAKSLRVAQ